MIRACIHIADQDTELIDWIERNGTDPLAADPGHRLAHKVRDAINNPPKLKTGRCD